MSPLTPRFSRSMCGDAIILLFLAVQAADGMFTYLGLSMLGTHLEANPVLMPLITWLGLAAAVTSTKLLTAGVGVLLHQLGVHRVVAAITGVYLLASLMPWCGIFLMQM